MDAEPDLKVLSRSVERGINICCTEDMRRIFVLGHFEYDRDTLATEYIRDKKKGMDPDLPEYYYPDNDSTEQPVFKWCSYAHLFYNESANPVRVDVEAVRYSDGKVIRFVNRRRNINK